MNKNEEILSRFSKESGYKVPEGYFEDFAKKMAASLPEREIKTEKATKWLRIRPYVYMAAMFAGVWCMMYLFNDMKGRTGSEYGYNEQLAEAMEDNQVARDVVDMSNIDDYDILQQMYEDNVDPSVFGDSSIN